MSPRPEYRFEQRGRNTQVQYYPVYERSRCRWYFLAFVVAEVVVAAWLFFSGYLTPADARDGLQAISLRGKLDEQGRQLERQSQALEALEKQLASSVLSGQIQATANEALRRKLLLAEQALTEARQRLLLYEDILSPESLEQGLAIQYLGLKQRELDAQGNKLEHGREYQYHLVLANIRGSELVEGRVEIRFSGTENGQQKSYSLQALRVDEGAEQTATSNFSLKYYQSLEGYLRLPDAFSPQTVTVELMPQQGKSRVTRKYDWDKLLLSR
ncbi:MAG: hypothetical protein KDI44_11070 [Thiothrix sp.]|nr:hypothetical protein [Thiothrix sp.]HPQ94161.1 hypothetical protein [Thiolinea sp.]